MSGPLGNNRQEVQGLLDDNVFAAGTTSIPANLEAVGERSVGPISGWSQSALDPAELPTFPPDVETVTAA